MGQDYVREAEEALADKDGYFGFINALDPFVKQENQEAINAFKQAYEKKKTPGLLHDLLACNNVSVFEAVLSKFSVNVNEKKGGTVPLYEAIERSNQNAMVALLRKGAEPFSVCEIKHDGQRFEAPVIFAALKVTQLFERYCGFVEIDDRKFQVHGVDTTMLYAAIRYGTVSSLCQVLEKVSPISDVEEKLPIELAITAGKAEMMKLLCTDFQTAQKYYKDKWQDILKVAYNFVGEAQRQCLAHLWVCSDRAQQQAFLQYLFEHNDTQTMNFLLKEHGYKKLEKSWKDVRVLFSIWWVCTWISHKIKKVISFLHRRKNWGGIYHACYGGKTYIIGHAQDRVSIRLPFSDTSINSDAVITIEEGLLPGRLHLSVDSTKREFELSLLNSGLYF